MENVWFIEENPKLILREFTHKIEAIETFTFAAYSP